MSITAVLFDFDGTLADSFPAIASSVNHVRERRGLPPLTVEQVKRFVGRGPEYLLANAVPGGNLAEDLACYRAHHPSVMVQQTWLLPGAGQVLAELHRRGMLLGLCSNKPRFYSQELLSHLGVAHFFHVVVGPEDVPRPKPAPDMVLHAITQLAVSPAEVLLVGDMSVDVETARAAGVRVWVVPTGTEDEATLAAAKPDRVLASLADLLPIRDWP
ncbi:MAG: HAD family hydrolase [Gemmataceae bacterium]|nr:HAD family hydrolase [Gemmataceae bacterium]